MHSEIQIMFHVLLFAVCLLIAATFYKISDAREHTLREEHLIIVIPFYSLFFFVPLEIVFWFLYWVFAS